MLLLNFYCPNISASRDNYCPIKYFWCLTKDSQHMHADNKSDVSIVSNEKLSWPLSLDKLSREFSCQLATGLLLWTFQISLCVYWELRKWYWLNVKELPVAPVLGAALFIVPGPISQVLPNRFLSRMGHIIPLPPPPAFVRRRTRCGTALSKQLQEKSR